MSRLHPDAITREGRRNLEAAGGREMKHTGDCIIASFATMSRDVTWASKVQQELEGAQPHDVPGAARSDRDERQRAGGRGR